MKEHSKEAWRIVEDKIAMFHKYTVITAVFLFILSIALSIFSQDKHSMVIMSRLMLYNASVLFITAEIFRLIKNWELRTKISLIIFWVETIGYALMGISALRGQFYNRGISYMVASFLISVAKEFNIVNLLVPKNQLKQKRYQFLSSINSCCAALLFFFGALVCSFWREIGERYMITVSLNSLSGILMSLSVYYTLKDEQYQGYSTMALSMSDER